MSAFHPEQKFRSREEPDSLEVTALGAKLTLGAAGSNIRFPPEADISG
jgi:hypothetical protein